ncbi:MAG: hypothetical protein ABIJ84_04810 [bacterium]
MYNLYIKKGKDKLISAIEKSFQTEEEFENYIMGAKEIFSDIFILRRQVHAVHSGRDIPDIIGIDRDNNIVIIENKNVVVTEDILSQILRYAFWAETNPDSIKAMWLETEDRPDDIEVEWDNVNIRVIVLAPSIKLSVPRLLKKINYAVDLVVVKRFLIGDEESILLHKFEEELEIKPKTARGLEIYDKEYQKDNRNPKSVDEFFSVVEEIEKIVKKNGWSLEKKLNKYYVGFKSGFPLVFGVSWSSSRSFGIFLKVQPKEVPEFRKMCPYEFVYDKQWKQAWLKYDSKISISKLEKTFKWTYDSFLEKQ